MCCSVGVGMCVGVSGVGVGKGVGMGAEERIVGLSVGVSKGTVVEMGVELGWVWE